MFGSKAGPGLSINTAAANTPKLTLTAPSSAPSHSTTFGDPQQPAPSSNMFGSSQPQAGGLFEGGATTQPAQAGGLFGSKPAGGLFGSSTSQPAPAGRLFGNTASQPQQAGSVFGNATSQPQQAGGLFGGGAPQAQQTGGLYDNSTQQPQQGGGLFGLGTQASQPQQQGGLFSLLQSQQNQQQARPSMLGGGLMRNASSGAKIDAEHLRPTTKYEQLNDVLQNEISNLDQFILNQIQVCHEVADMLPSIAASGQNLPNDVEYVSQKLEEVEAGLENDAEEIVNLRDGVVKRDAGDAKVCFRQVDRLKMPQQYQSSQTSQPGVTGGVYGGSGLSGWWNHPQTLQRSIRAREGGGGKSSITLPGDEDDEAGVPTSMIDLFERRAEEMKQQLTANRDLLKRVEDFVEGVEAKIVQKERDLVDDRTGAREPEDQVKMLRYVFGAVERSLYDVADKVGGARDGVQDLVMSTAEKQIKSRLD